MTMRSIVHVSLCLLAWSLTMTAATAQPRPRTDTEVKAAYLVEFGRYFTRQQAVPAGEPFRLCVLGADRFGPALDAATTDAAIENRPVAVQRLTQPRDARTCDVLFISDSEQPDLPDILSALGDAAVLTVSDMPHFVSSGGMIQFVPRGSKVQFEINVVSSRNAGINLGAKLLNVAVAVHNGREVRRR